MCITISFNLCFINQRRKFIVSQSEEPHLTLPSSRTDGKGGWKHGKKCDPNKDKLLVPIIFYMIGIAIDRHRSTTRCPLKMILCIFSDLTCSSTRPNPWETLFFHPQGKNNQLVDNVNNLHCGLWVALASSKAI